MADEVVTSKELADDANVFGRLSLYPAFLPLVLTSNFNWNRLLSRLGRNDQMVKMCTEFWENNKTGKKSGAIPSLRHSFLRHCSL